MNKRSNKLHVKKGDQVIVIAGSSKGHQGEVLQVLAAKDRVIVEGANLVKKHVKPTQESQGGIVEQPAGIHISNVALVDPTSGKACRVGRKKEDGKSVRYSKQSGEIIK